MLQEEDGVVDVEVSVNGQALVFVSTCCTVAMTTRPEEGAREMRCSFRPPGGNGPHIFTHERTISTYVKGPRL